MAEQPGKRTAAVFSDIHSNYHAFKACFDDALLHGADCFIFLGDYVSDLAESRKTMDLVYQIRSAFPTFCLRGNRERYMLDHRNGLAEFRPGSKTGSLLYTDQQLRMEDLCFFESLPVYDVIELCGVTFEIAHAGKDDDRHYYTADSGGIKQIFRQMRSSYWLTGHCHQQYLRTFQGKTVINPGSIGVPRGYGSLSQYAILEIEDQNVRCQFYQIPYDLKAAIHSQFESGLVDLAKCWALGVLYDIITGEEYTMELLRRVSEQGAEYDEQLWHRTAAEMGMAFTEDEILDFLYQIKRN